LGFSRCGSSRKNACKVRGACARFDPTPRIRQREQAPAPYTYLQSQRDCVLQPRVARHELPWVRAQKTSSTPTGLCRSPRLDPTHAVFPVAFFGSMAQLLRSWCELAGVSQGSSCLATLGFEAESLWDSPIVLLLLKMRVRCRELAPALAPSCADGSGSKLHALHTLRDFRSPYYHVENL